MFSLFFFLSRWILTQQKKMSEKRFMLLRVPKSMEQLVSQEKETISMTITNGGTICQISSKDSKEQMTGRVVNLPTIVDALNNNVKIGQVSQMIVCLPPNGSLQHVNGFTPSAHNVAASYERPDTRKKIALEIPRFEETISNIGQETHQLELLSVE
jgi:hypothetical protein